MNQPREYAFGNRLVMSQGVSTSSDIREILIANIPGAVNAHQAATVNDKNGTDWWVEHASGKHLSIDCKVRESDWAATHPNEDDLALESWSVMERRILGWTLNRSKRTDFIFWFWLDTKRWCLVPFPMLCHVARTNINEWRKKYRVARQFTPDKNYHSECVFVPRREIWAEIYRHFGGAV